MSKSNQLIARLQELKAEHEASIGKAGAEAPGFIQDEQSTRKSYKLVVQEGLESGAISQANLDQAGLPDNLE